MLDILDYLHGRNPPVIHRDIKPSNILLTNRFDHQVGNVYLVDFGSVQTRVREAGTVTIVGTYGYMPPEQFRGQASPASDLYGLGATLIYLGTGQEPANLMHDDWQIHLEPTANLSQDLVDWLQWMTQPDRRQRLASAKDAQQALEQPCNRLFQQVNMPPQISPFLIMGKPMRTEISVHKSADILKIIIPFTEYGGYWFIGTLIAWIFFSFHLLHLLPFVWNIIVFFIVSVSVWIGTQPPRPRNIQTCIRIDRELIQVFRRVDSGKARCIFLADRRTIDKIAYTKRLYHRQSEGGIVEVLPELKIWINYNSYRVGQLPKASIDTAFRGTLTLARTGLGCPRAK